MSVLRNLLVGVDLSRINDAGTVVVDSVAVHTVRDARWLADQCGARLTFFSVLPPAGTGEVGARHALDTLVRETRAHGTECDGVIAAGLVWLEMTRKVVRDRHDLLVIGTHDPHGLRRLLLGSTARTLLHECPCPVWVSKPRTAVAPRNILIASDLSPLSDLVVRVGLGIGHLGGAHSHILDVVEYPLDRVWVPHPFDAATRRYHHRRRAEADEALHAQVERTGGDAADPSVTVHVVDGDGLPDHAIVRFVHDHHIDLLVLGTHARHGIAGALLGNTAERLLPDVPCSVLAVKPADFRSGVKFDTAPGAP